MTLHAVIGRAAFAATLAVVAGGPFDIELLNTPIAPGAQGHARLLFAPSVFGVAVTSDGHASYNAMIDASGLPDPATLGASAGYVAWAVSPSLAEWHRLGTVKNGNSVVGQVALDKFLLVITAEADTASRTRTGPTVLHGTSPSGWLQSFLSHPLFRGLPP